MNYHFLAVAIIGFSSMVYAQELPVYLQGKPIIKVSGTVTKVTAQGIVVSNNVSEKVATGGNRQVAKNKTTKKTEIMQVLSMPHYYELRNYTNASRVKVGDTISTKGVVISNNGNTDYVHWCPDAAKPTKWK